MSSPEAELYAATRALSDAKGLKSSSMDVGEDPRIRANLDVQATAGLRHRAGLGKARDKETAELRIQGTLERQEWSRLEVSTARLMCSPRR